MAPTSLANVLADNLAPTITSLAGGPCQDAANPIGKHHARSHLSDGVLLGPIVNHSQQPLLPHRLLFVSHFLQPASGLLRTAPPVL